MGCPYMVHPQNMHIPGDQAQGPLLSSQHCKRLYGSPQIELSAQLTVTKDHKKKKHQTCKHGLIPFHECCIELRALS